MRGRRRRRGGGKSGGSNFYHRAAFPQVHFAVPLDNGAHIRIRGGAVRAAKREEKNVKGKKKVPRCNSSSPLSFQMFTVAVRALFGSPWRAAA